MSIDFPKYCKKDLIVGNPKACTGVVTLWTDKNEVAKVLDKNKYALIGQLYSKDGINMLIRNLLAHKSIHCLVMLGKDMTGSGDALKKFFDDGIIDFDIDKLIPKSSIESLLLDVMFYDCRDETLKEVNELLSNNEQHYEHSEEWGKSEIFPEKIIEAPSRYPSEKVGFIVREEKIGDAWIRLLDTIMKYGTRKQSSYSDGQIELLDLITVTNEPKIVKGALENIDFRDYYLFTRDHLENYYDQILTDKGVEGINYTYGQRLRSHFGVDQIQNVIDELWKQRHSRRAVAVTYDVKLDYNNSHAPCLDLIQCNVQDDFLYLTAYIRSNDMVKAWVENAYGLRALQYRIATSLNVFLGNLTTISCSAHIYDSDINFVTKLIREHSYNIKYDDPRGNFLIDIRDGSILLFRTIKGINEILIAGTSAKDITERIVKSNFVINPYHCLYLGRELQKAEYCLKNNLQYVQG